MRHAVDTGVSRESRHWHLDYCAVARLAVRVSLCVRQVCSWGRAKSIGRLGPCFDFRTILGDRHSATDLRTWLQRGILVSQQAIASLDSVVS